MKEVLFLSLPGIYLHIPFCTVKCPYCDFYSVAATQEAMEQYTDALCRMLRQLPEEFPGLTADTLYLGGGTPSLLGVKRLDRILAAASHSLHLSQDAEITLEANPGQMPPPFSDATISRETLGALRRSGFNRISFGLQSTDPFQLRFLGRRHSAAEGLQAAELAFAAGFEDINLDLMLGLEGQTEETISRSVQLCAQTPANHLSAYLLKVEENTRFYRQKVWERCPDEDRQAQLYLYAVAQMQQAGFIQYEISNFAKNSRISRHNFKYWDSIPYLGIGPAAHSFWNGKRFSIPRNWKAFAQAHTLAELMQPEGEGGDGEEYLMLRLRLTQGVQAAALAQRHPEISWEQLCRRAKPYEKAGLLRMDPDPGQGFVSLTPSGFLVSNSLIAHLIG